MLPYSVSFLLNGWNADLGLRRKGIILRALLWAVTSLWPQNAVCRSQIYSARAKLKLISDQARDLVKMFCQYRRLFVRFKTNGTSGILNKLTVSAKSTRDDLCGESESYWERVIWWYFSRIKCGNIVPGWLWIALSVPRTWLIVWFSQLVDGRISGMSWCSCYKNSVYKHKNASWVFSWSDFVLDNRFWAQER